jgi:hypothetical protein
MRKYTDPKGGLEITKAEAPVATETATVSKKAAKAKAAAQPVEFSAEKVVETAESYQLPMFTANPAGECECFFCGKKTSYANRWVCVDCWKLYNKELMEGIKNAVSDVTVTVE